MNEFLKAAACILTGLILWLCLGKYSKDMSVLLTLAICAMVLIGAFAILEPVMDFFNKLQTIADLDNALIGVVLKALGIGLLGEVCALICKDAGNESLGKTLQIFATVTILWLSIPVFEKLLTLLDEILGTV